MEKIISFSRDKINDPNLKKTYTKLDLEKRYHGTLNTSTQYTLKERKLNLLHDKRKKEQRQQFQCVDWIFRKTRYLGRFMAIRFLKDKVCTLI